MIEVTVNHIGEVQFEVIARNHTVFSDQPVENGGYDEGMTPPELLLASLGSCAGYYAVEYLKARKLPMRGLSIRVRAEKAQAPPRLDDIRIDVDYSGGLDERHREGLFAAVRKCLIHNTLLHPPKISVGLRAQRPLAA